MKGREGKGPPSTDLLVCFPSRAHLRLMPKPICSPARPSEPNKRQHNHQQHHSSHHHHPHQHHNHYHHLKQSSNRNGVAGQASPILWAKTKPISKETAEPTSPKVTCAGQIRVKPKASSCKSWQSVMEEIEKLHNHKKQKKRPAWVEAIGFKKDIMQFLTCLRSIRFDFRCFGAFPSTAINSDDEDDGDEDDNEYQDNHQNHAGREASDDSEASRTVFSKWFMVLQENNTTTNDFINKDNKVMIRDKLSDDGQEEEAIEAPCVPPPNALLLMRCRSAPAKSWLEEIEEDQEDNEEESHDDQEENEKRKREEDEKRIKIAMEEEKKRNDNLIVMRCGTDFYKFSSDIAKETWVVGGIKDSLSRSRSWKR